MGIKEAGGTWFSDSPAISFRDLELLRMGPQDFYKYLGVKMGVTGPNQGRNLHLKLQRLLDCLRSAPLKPQQKLWALKVCLLPKILHQAVFADPTKKTLKSLDLKVRKFTRKLCTYQQIPHLVPSIQAQVRVDLDFSLLLLEHPHSRKGESPA